MVNRCIAAEPHHGAVWQAIAKDDRNAGKSVKDVLELVAVALH